MSNYGRFDWPYLGISCRGLAGSKTFFPSCSLVRKKHLLKYAERMSFWSSGTHLGLRVKRVPVISDLFNSLSQSLKGGFSCKGLSSLIDTKIRGLKNRETQYAQV